VGTNLCFNFVYICISIGDSLIQRESNVSVHKVRT